MTIKALTKTKSNTIKPALFVCINRVLGRRLAKRGGRLAKRDGRLGGYIWKIQVRVKATRGYFFLSLILLLFGIIRNFDSLTLIFLLNQV